MAKATRTAPAGALARVRKVKARVQSRPERSKEEIARRAYELFLQEGGVHGRDIDHWLMAERQLLDQFSVSN